MQNNSNTAVDDLLMARPTKLDLIKWVIRTTGCTPAEARDAVKASRFCKELEKLTG